MLFNLDLYFAEIFPQNKIECRCFIFLYFISKRIGNPKFVVIKYNLNYMKNITEKFIISEKLTFIEIIEHIQIT